MRLAPHNPAGEASEGRDQSAGYARRSHSHAIADVGSIPTVSTIGSVEPKIRSHGGYDSGASSLSTHASVVVS
jgi:hypothetical protein